MYRNTKFTEQEINRLNELYDSGLSYADLINNYGFCAATIRRYVKKSRSTSDSILLAKKQGKCVLTENGRRNLSESGKMACQRSGKYWTKPELEFKKIVNLFNIGVKFPDYIKEIKNVEDDSFETLLCYQYPIRGYVLDFVWVQNKVAININGDYWHANPLLYDLEKLGDFQETNIRQDKNKKAYLIKNGWKVVDIWESDIYFNKNLIKEKLIEIGIINPCCDINFPKIEIDDWSEKLKTMWFKTDKPKRIKSENIKVICANNLCGKEFETLKRKNRTKKYCSVECSNEAKRKVNRPTREKLEQLIKEYSMTKIGDMFGVSNNSVKKWAKKYGLI